jgi:hypothetical protein
MSLSRHHPFEAAPEVPMLDNSHSVMAEGTDVGIIGGLAVALWFLILDSLAGHPFQTPSLLGQVVLFGDSTPDTKHLVFGAILVVLVHWGERDSVVRYALLPVFLVFEVMFYGLLDVFSERTNELFPFWAVVSANTLAALSMAGYLWHKHPEFRRAVRETPLGDAPS